MASYKIYWKASTKQVKVLRATDTAPGGFTNIKTFTHGSEGDTLGGDSHVLYHHVRDALYAQGQLDMSIIDIMVFDTIINVSGVSMTPATATLSLAGTTTQQLTLTFTPAAPDNTAVTYVSSDPTKATVSAGGLVTAVAAGSTTITVTTADGHFTDTTVITVTA